jgi:type IV secretory pathway ATPase VirB11/archaellum biosynthesis ATPase
MNPQESSEKPTQRSLLDFRKDADRGHEPQFVSGRVGTRLYSLVALQERIESQLLAEHNTEEFKVADTPTKRLQLILQSVNYVLAVESIAMDGEAKAHLIEAVYSSIFGYGILDTYFLDPRVTTIDIHGTDHISVRYGHGELQATGAMFTDEGQLQRILSQLLLDAGAELRDGQPIIETGLKIGNRSTSLTLVAPPISPYFHADIRLHPAEALTLDDLVSSDFLSEDAARLVRLIAQSKHGFMVVGEPESGKTTLLNALASLLDPAHLVTVERAGELRLPVATQTFKATWRVGDSEAITFGNQIEAAVTLNPHTLILDEVRSDEPTTILPLLGANETIRQIWSVRGVSDAKRLQSSMGMLARRADMTRSEMMVRALYDRLPFVITVCRIKERLQVFSVAEWQSRADSDYPDYVLLMQYRDGEARATGNAPARWLD